MISPSILFELLATHGGKIVTTANLSTDEINQAVATDRMYVDDNSVGYVWIPDISTFPTTKQELNFFNKWYPLKTLKFFKNYWV